MLYDPKWNTKADPHSLSSLVAWLEQQPPEGEYNYVNSDNCLLCQYFRAVGVPVRSLNSQFYTLPDGTTSTYPKLFDRIANEGWWVDTFGAALARARIAEAGHAL